jgi:hypothetical protein
MQQAVTTTQLMKRCVALTLFAIRTRSESTAMAMHSLCDSAYVRSIVSIYLGRRKMSINPWLIFWLAFAVMMLLGSYL